MAGWIWLGYLAALALVDLLIYTNRPAPPVVSYHLINAAPALLFLGLAYSPWLTTRGRALVPLLIGVVSATPILLTHLFDLHLPAAPLSNLEGMVLRQMPVLFLGLVLVAWHYRFPIVLAYSGTTYLFELLAVTLLVPFSPDQQLTFYFVITIRAISLLVVGVFLNQLIRRLRAQHVALQAANLKLAQHAATLETLTVSRERNRLARELHDTLAHTLSGLAVQLETTKAYWNAQPATAYQLLDSALATTRSGLAETRRALKALRASPLEDLGLRLALQQLAEAAAERGRLTLALTLPAPLPELNAEVEQALYRIAQEALENVVRHAAARTLSVRLAVQEAELEMTIADDGIGLSPDRAGAAGHFGLAGLRERAELAGGRLAVESQPGQGTTIRVTLTGRRS